MGQAKLVQNLYDSRIPSGNPLTKCEKNLATSVVKSSPSSVVSHQRQLQGSDSLSTNTSTHLYPLPHMGILQTNILQYLLCPIFSPRKFLINLCSCYDVSPIKSILQTGQLQLLQNLENDLSGKIEKLRRRQQMRALLAIKNNSSNLSLLASFDPNSPLEKNDSNMVAVAIDDHSDNKELVIPTNLVLQLDIRTRLCIRDSLFRLAQSAMQRHYASYTSSTSIISKVKLEFQKKKLRTITTEVWSLSKLKNYMLTMSETETETNPIDRTVAHLLFLRPLILSRKHPETPESLASTKLPCEHKTVSKVPSPLLDCKHLEQFKNSPFVDASENASNNHPADAEVEASHRNLELF
ncbi:hypothetical protein F3Y22_tig00110267pilonHSYRG00047 [Hibiscus syriacus]|uniref:Uncharacterized protein n=1 Tax=Hibiscus syriacus TaxID=106335 RepID=A0A6A3B6Q5_HIBSY|nr:hypothetical protein F3Y22_tig00110267pilonHSYRG00047 [Hibiscus syriacus]